MKERPKLESKFEEWVQAAIKYARTIDDFDELIDPRTPARHCLGSEPSLYVLNTLNREERKHKLPLHRGSSYPLFLRHQGDIKFEPKNLKNCLVKTRKLNNCLVATTRRRRQTNTK